jgi:HEAT repeat protein
MLLCGSLAQPALAYSAVPRGNTLQEPQLTPIQREIEHQRERLDSSDVEERRDALMRLRTIDRREASRIAARGLSDLVPIVRATSAHAVVHLPSEEAAGLLIPLLQDRVEFVRQEVAYALGETHSRSAVGPLANLLLSDKKDSVRGAAAVALGQIGDESAVVALSQVLTGPNGAAITSATGKTKKAAKRKGRENDLVLLAAAHSLGQIRSRAGVPALIAVLSDETTYPDARREAATALGLIGDQSAAASLRAVLTSGDPYLSQSADNALRRLGAAR